MFLAATRVIVGWALSSSMPARSNASSELPGWRSTTRCACRVPPALAVIPASIVAVVLIPAGLMNVRMGVDLAVWGTNVPSMLWIVWGAALGAAACAYRLRRRGICRYCQVGEHFDRPAHSVHELWLCPQHLFRHPNGYCGLGVNAGDSSAGCPAGLTTSSEE